MNHHTRFAEIKKIGLCFYKQLGVMSVCVTECVCYSSLRVLESLGGFLLSDAEMPKRCYCGNILIVMINDSIHIYRLSLFVHNSPFAFFPSVCVTVSPVSISNSSVLL